MWSVWWWQKDDSFHTVLCMTLIHISLFGFFTVYTIFVQKTVQLNCINEWNLCFISDSIQRHIGLCTFWLYFFLISQHLIKQFLFLVAIRFCCMSRESENEKKFTINPQPVQSFQCLLVFFLCHSIECTKVPLIPGKKSFVQLLSNEFVSFFYFQCCMESYLESSRWLISPIEVQSQHDPMLKRGKNAPNMLKQCSFQIYI